MIVKQGSWVFPKALLKQPFQEVYGVPGRKDILSKDICLLSVKLKILVMEASLDLTRRAQTKFPRQDFGA